MGKKITKEQSTVADELAKMFRSCEKKGVELDYVAYLVFSIIGGKLVKDDKKQFKAYVKEIESRQ